MTMKKKKQKPQITASESGRMGGEKTKEKYGNEHFSKIVKQRWAKQKKGKK